jgi:hypothetical protein
MDNSSPKDPKGIALLIGKRLDDKGAAPSEDTMTASSDQDGDSAQHDQMETSAVSSLLKAFKNGDVSGAKTALCDFIDMYQMRGD